jgi:hypothetical protein
MQATASCTSTRATATARASDPSKVACGLRWNWRAPSTRRSERGAFVQTDHRFLPGHLVDGWRRAPSSQAGETVMMDASSMTSRAHRARLWSGIHLCTPWMADPYRRVVEANSPLEPASPPEDRAPSPMRGTPKTTRLRRLDCADGCGYTVRLSRKWLDAGSLPVPVGACSCRQPSRMPTVRWSAGTSPPRSTR